MKQKKCKDLVTPAARSRLKELKELVKSNLDEFYEYALSFDYVWPDTFSDQKIGYFRYQISWGGPSEEIRYYTNLNYSIWKADFWYLDWFDEAREELTGEWFDAAKEIFDMYEPEYVFEQAREEVREFEGIVSN